jgi:TctA family transporter
MGVMAAISVLLPLTFAMKPVAAILMLAGIYCGAQYGRAICSILLNLPGHPPHAVTCLDGYPLIRRGRGGPADIMLAHAAWPAHGVDAGGRVAHKGYGGRISGNRLSRSLEL